MSKIGDFLMDKIGKQYFTVESNNGIPALAQNNDKRIVIGVIRETIGPFINRSTVPDETISFEVGNGDNTKEIIEVPARKFKSKEKLLGLRFCRLHNILDTEYRYNGLSKLEQINNPASVVFGDTIVEGGDAGNVMFPSRVLYSSSYSIRDKSEITERLTHNSLSENGTMWDSVNGKNRTSLFNTEYVVPGVYFPSFLTLIDPTPEMLYFVLVTLKSSSYGAQTSITGNNFRNSPVFILGCNNEPPISSYVISREWNNKEVNYENVRNEMIEKTRYLVSKESNMVCENDLKSIMDHLDNTSYEDSDEAMKKLQSDSNAIYTFSNFGKKKTKGKKSTGSEEKENEESEE